MAVNAPSTRNVAAAKPNVGGGVCYAPPGTTVPTDASTPLGAEFTALGYITDEGVQPTRDTSIEKIKAWGGDVIAALKSDDSRSFAFTVYEIFNGAVQTFIYGEDNVEVTPATADAGTKIAVQDKADKPGDCVLVIDMKFEGKKRRVVIPAADNNVTDESPYADNSLGAYEITTEALKDEDGVRVYDYLENDDKTGTVEPPPENDESLSVESARATAAKKAATKKAAAKKAA